MDRALTPNILRYFFVYMVAGSRVYDDQNDFPMHVEKGGFSVTIQLSDRIVNGRMYIEKRNYKMDTPSPGASTRPIRLLEGEALPVLTDEEKQAFDNAKLPYYAVSMRNFAAPPTAAYGLFKGFITLTVVLRTISNVCLSYFNPVSAFALDKLLSTFTLAGLQGSENMCSPGWWSSSSRQIEEQGLRSLILILCSTLDQIVLIAVHLIRC